MLAGGGEGMTGIEGVGEAVTGAMAGTLRDLKRAAEGGKFRSRPETAARLRIKKPKRRFR